MSAYVAALKERGEQAQRLAEVADLDCGAQ